MKTLAKVILGLMMISSMNDLFAQTSLNGTSQTIIGKAIDLNPPHLALYQEKRMLEAQGFKSEYIQKNQKFAVKTLVKSNIPWQPQIEVKYTNLDYALQVSSNEGGAQIFFREKGSEKRNRIKITANTVWDAGIHDYILYKWSNLIQGKTVMVDLLVPEKADIFSFRLRPISTAGQYPLKLILEPQNQILRWILDPIYVYYNEKKEITYYEGISDIKNSQYENFKVKMNY